ncbi:Ca2+-binding RTX toxin-like protein [Agrobacterium vitis]|nr:Ca2+-binding RTX toxin-like protein [Agrobacterium vitis]MBE1438303.1 Ca2+-binding RTX toxin-like protein [Agrobacterium vitis]
MAFNGTSGNDVMDYSNYAYPQPADWPEHQQWIELNGLAGNDTIYGSSNNDGINGGEGNDTLYGNDGQDALSGGNGTDYLYGGNGDDYLTGDAGNDYLYGGNGVDWIVGGDGNDYMSGGAGDDTFVGGTGADTMLGGAGDDVFFGDAGNDIITGEAGNDRLWAGSGNDQYQFNGQGIDIINDGVTNTGQARTDATYDTADSLSVSYTLSQLYLYGNTTNGLVITSASDVADGIVDNAVVIDNFFAGGHFVVEYLYTSDGYQVDMTQFLAAA